MIKYLLVLLLCATPALALDDPLADNISEVATWFENKTAALSITFDDSVTSRTDAAEALDDHFISATFYLNSQALIDDLGTMVADFGTMFSNGHEIGNHTEDHANLVTQPNDAARRQQIDDSEAYLEANITGGYEVVSLAYPFGARDAGTKVIAAENNLNARGTWPYTPPNTSDPADMFDLGEMGRPGKDQQGNVEDPWTDLEFKAEMLRRSQEVVASGGWGIEVYHNLSLTLDENDGLYTTDAARRYHYADLVGNSTLSGLWVAPVGTVTKYIEQRNGTVLATSCDGGTDITITVNHSLDPVLYDVPITILTRVPSAWNIGDITADQTGALPVYATSVSGTSAPYKYVRITVDMDGGDVTVTGPSTCYPVFTDATSCGGS